MKTTSRQEEILDVAKKMFAERGYAETTMREIAAKLDVKAASLYSHFVSKEAILEAICNVIYRQMAQNMQAITEKAVTAEEKFLMYIGLHIKCIITYGEEFAIYNKYWNIVDGKANRRFGLLNFEYFEFIKILVRNMFPKEEEKDFYVPSSTALFLIDTLNNVPKLINPDNPDIDKVVEDVQYRIIYGFKKDMS